MVFHISTLFFTTLVMYLIYRAIVFFVKREKTRQWVVVIVTFCWVMAIYPSIISFAKYLGIL